MPNTVSAKKRLRQNATHRLRNRVSRTVLRSQVRKIRAAVDKKDVAASEAEFRVLAKKLDQAASKHLIHANAAARTKSRLCAAIKAIKTGK